MLLCPLMQTVLTVKRDPRVFLTKLFVVEKQVKYLANRVTMEDQNTIKAERFMIFLLALGSSWSSLSSSLKINDRSRSFEGSSSLSSDSYRGIKNVQDLFKLSIDKNYYKPTLVKSGYINIYIRYES